MLLKPGKVVVIGRSRQGKSFIGNCFAGSEEIDPFLTAEGIKGCTDEITSRLFRNVEIPDTKETIDLTYTDTPGFPDFDPETKSYENSVGYYTKIVEYINKNRPDAIIWVINTTSRNPEDEGMNKTFSLLIKDFKKTGIYCAVLVNNQGSKRSFKRKVEREKTKVQIQNHIKGYGIENFTDGDHIYYSYYEDLLKVEVLRIVLRAQDREVLDVKEARTFEKIEADYAKGFDSATATKHCQESLNSKIDSIKYDIGWHKKRIQTCTTVMQADTVSGFLIGFGLAITTFGLSHTGMILAREDSRLKLVTLEGEKTMYESQSIDSEDVLRHAKEEFEEFCGILTALKQDVTDLRKRYSLLCD